MNWQNEVSYKIGDVVVYDGKSYKCIFAHKSIITWVPSIFTQSVWSPISAASPPVAAPPVITPPVAAPPVITPIGIPHIVKPTIGTKSRSLSKLLNGKRPYGAYYESWAAKWTGSGSNSDLANVKHANIIYLSFAVPDCTYKLGQNTWAGTGLSFSSDFAVIKDAVAILQNRGVVVMLSVGGATYPFSSSYNADGLANLVKDLGLNGIDIDWENHDQKAQFGNYISETRRALGENLAVSAATFSVGAYGEGVYANALPPSANTGMNIGGLKSNGSQLDWINIMTYDASDEFDPLIAYNAYKSYYSGPLLIGAEVPPEAWGGHIINLNKVKQYCNHVKTDTSNIGGIFVWAYYKQGTPNCNDILSTSINTFGVSAPVAPPLSPVAPPLSPVAPPLSPVTPSKVTDLIGKSVLGFQFFQDTESEWARIDNTTIGELEQYSYKTFDGPVVGDILDMAILDSKVVAVLYEWKTGKAYSKTGFDLNNTQDIKSNPGFTTFVVKSRAVPVSVTPVALIGRVLFGNTVVQDNKPEWVKIDNVVVGDKFTYQSYNTQDIGNLLDTVINDTNVVALLYNRKTGDAYSKSGVDFGNSSDTKLNTDFISFIVKSRINNKGQVPVFNNGNFIKWQNNKFLLNGAKFVPVGFNAYWLGYTEKYEYPKKPEITQMFILAQKMKATVIRSHTLGITSGQWNTLRKSDNTFNNNAWDVIDFAFQEANKYGIKLIVPFTDAYSYYHGHYGHWCETRKVHKDVFFTNKDVRNDFKKSIGDWLNHVNSYTGVAIKDDPALFCIENGNELGNYRPSATSVVKPTKEWLVDINNFIRTIDKNHMILDGSDECLDNFNFEVSSTDILGAHFYWKDYERLDRWVNKAKSLNKPYIVGEYNLKYDDGWYKDMENRNGISGTVMWSLYPNENGKMGGTPILHNDGFTINAIPNDMWKLTGLSNHFRRMQKMPEISNLSL